jgi:hypothetical protein
MISRNIKDATIAKLAQIQALVAAGNATEANYQLSDIIDSLSSSMVSVVYSREESTSRPGDCKDANELVARNID